MLLSIDDTDSRDLGMCTTYVGTMIANRLSYMGASITQLYLIRLNPSAKHKTRGNASVAIEFTGLSQEKAFSIATQITFANARVSDDETNPAVLCTDETLLTKNQKNDLQEFAQKSIYELVSIEEAENHISTKPIKSSYRGNGRGRIGALAALGSKRTFDDWTYECISYRSPDNWGTKREVLANSVSEVSKTYYPVVWDTYDHTVDYPVCVPKTPCPILYGIRGDSKDQVIKVANSISSEPIYAQTVFKTNQGTDSHIQSVNSITDISENSCYKVSGKVVQNPETIEGGHVFFTVEDETGRIEVAAFEPTKHFRDYVRKLKKGDVIEMYGEVTGDLLKLEKFEICSLKQTRKKNPTCPECTNSMSSAGRNQGYRCRGCKTAKDDKETVPIIRDLETKFYEVPPCARRHLSKPLVRMSDSD